MGTWCMYQKDKAERHTYCPVASSTVGANMGKNENLVQTLNNWVIDQISKSKIK